MQYSYILGDILQYVVNFILRIMNRTVSNCDRRKIRLVSTGISSFNKNLIQE